MPVSATSPDGKCTTNDPYDFWLWGYLKIIVCQAHVPYVSTLEDRILLHADILRPSVENVVYRMRL